MGEILQDLSSHEGDGDRLLLTKKLKKKNGFKTKVAQDRIERIIKLQTKT